MIWWVAILLGIIQGIFMFFPVSSTSHLALMQHWLIGMGISLPDPDSAEMILFDLVVHVGTLVSIAVVFRESLSIYLRQAIQGFLNLVDSSKKQTNIGGLYVKLTLLGIVSVAVTGLIGFPMKAAFESIFAQPIIISLTLTTTGILLWWTDILSDRKIGLRQMGLWIAIIVGVAQGLALMPGLSRSGTTIAFALFVGLQRKEAAEFSFFIAIPTILGACLLQGIEVYMVGGLLSIPVTSLLIGFSVAALIGIAALYLVLNLLYDAKFRFFSYYVWILAAIIAFTSVEQIL